jgi:hypothetical protein
VTHCKGVAYLSRGGLGDGRGKGGDLLERLALGPVGVHLAQDLDRRQLS